MRRLSLIPKFLTSDTGQQIITTHLLPNVLLSKEDNQAMKFGQLIEYNMRNTFPQKLDGMQDVFCKYYAHIFAGKEIIIYCIK